MTRARLFLIILVAGSILGGGLIGPNDKPYRTELDRIALKATAIEQYYREHSKP